MNWQDVAPIQYIIQDALPPGVIAHTSRLANRDAIRIILCDWEETTKYFEKEYAMSILTSAQLTTQILTDIQEFNNKWNSPLMKALK